MSWETVELGDALSIKHGFAFKSTYFADEGSYLVLTPGNFYEEGGFRLRPGKDRAYVGDLPEDYILEEGDLIIAMTEQGPGLLGSSAIVPEGNRYLHNQRLGLVENLDESVLNKHFLYYLFNTRSVRGQISGSASGTKVRHTSPERIYRVGVSVSDIKSQARIAEILTAYDDLIENNRQRMALLEEAARQLYREWFVRLRFPGYEHTCMTNGVPDGWKKRRLDELADVTMGQSPPSSLYNEVGEGLPFHQGVGDFGDQFVTHRVFTAAKNRIAESDDILCSVRAPVGRLNVTTDKIVIGRGLAAIRSKFGQRSFLLRQLQVHFFKEDMIGAGAIFASVSKRELFAQRMLTPHEQLISLFEEKVRPIDEQIRTLFIENHKLRAARDLLLPRLMSGEITV